MAEALDTRRRARGAALNDAGAARPKTIADLPKELLVSIFVAIDDQTWVRRTFPLVCKEWNEIYCSQDASPLHETLEVDFHEEIKRAKQERRRRVARSLTAEAAAQELASYRPVVHASRVISWAQGRAGSVRKLRLVSIDAYVEDEDDEEDMKDFSSGDLGTLVYVVRSSLTEIRVSFDGWSNKPYEKQLWKSLRDHVAPAGRLRSLVVEGIGSALLESDVEPLAQLAGSLEELVLQTANVDEVIDEDAGLSAFPKSLCDLTELRRLKLVAHQNITALPAGISSLKKLEELGIDLSNLSSLPKELGELSGLTKLDLSYNEGLGSTPEGEPLPADEAFPAELGKLKSLRDLRLYCCGLRTVPAFVGGLKSLETLTLRDNLSSLPKELGELSGLTRLRLSSSPNLGTRLPAAEAFPAELKKMKSLRELDLTDCGLRTVPAFVGELKSLETLDLRNNNLSSLPEELGELSGLAKLVLRNNKNLGNSLESAPFPAELRRLKSLRYLDLTECDLRAVPAFVGGLESLEALDLSDAINLQVDAPLDFLIEGCPRLRHVLVFKRQDLWATKSLDHLEAFKLKLLAKNANATVMF